MASSKEMQQAPRPLTHRLSISAATPSTGPAPRQTHSRTHSHSILGSTLNASHRVTRRKSMNGTAANVAAVAAALSEAVEGGDKAAALPITVTSRRNTMSKPGFSRASIAASLPSPPHTILGQQVLGLDEKLGAAQDSAIDDDFNDMSGEDGDKSFDNARVRRASDGQPLAGGSRKFNRVELRCEKCGKGYKHSSCLTKHLWEHTPEWSFTSKLLISKHQQVQLLEAASVLVAMNNNPSATGPGTPPDSARDFTSDQDSASPAASGYSDLQDGRSSADTTPPPQMDAINESWRTLSKRYSSGSGFSRSYQSAPLASSIASSAPNGNGFSFGHFRQQSQDQRPPSSGKNATDQEDRELAAAVELLSCSFGSNNGLRTVHLPFDAPPVPPLPAQYLDQVSGTSFMSSRLDPVAASSFMSSFPQAQESFLRGPAKMSIRHEDVKMEESGDSLMGDDDDDDLRPRARSYEDDDGVFGHMEE